MKILEQQGWAGTPRVCLKCCSRVLVETDDLFWSPSTQVFYAECGYCQSDVILADDDIPEHIRRAVRKGNTRFNKNREWSDSF